MKTYYDQHKNPITVTDDIEAGGRGTIYLIEGAPDQVAKIMHVNMRSDSRRKKMEKLAGLSIKGVVLPLRCLYDDRGTWVGYTMKKIEGMTVRATLSSRPLSSRNRVRVLIQIAIIIRRCHEHDIVISDLDLANWMFDGSYVWLIDPDAFQICDETTDFRSQEAHLKSPEQMTAGFCGGKLLSNDSDNYLFAVIAHELLFLSHPLQRADEAYSIEEEANIRQRNVGDHCFAYREGAGAKPADLFGDEIETLFTQAFTTSDTPEIGRWLSALKKVNDAGFETCSCKGEKMVGKPCPWCGKKQGMKPRPASLRTKGGGATPLIHGIGFGAFGLCSLSTICCASAATFASAVFWNLCLTAALFALLSVLWLRSRKAREYALCLGLFSVTALCVPGTMAAVLSGATVLQTSALGWLHCLGM